MDAANREALAQRVVEGYKIVCRKLKDMEEDIRALWAEFDALPAGDTIMGCKTKTQFCAKYLDRELRSVRYMLDGGNRHRGETVSPDPAETDFDVLDVVYEKVSAFVCAESASHPVQTLPVLVDALTNGRTLTSEEIETLDAIVESLRQISDMANEYHYKLMGLRPMEKVA